MAIDIYTSRKGKFFKCVYWKRDLSQDYDNNQLILKVAPNGVFYANIATESQKGMQDISNAMLIQYVRTTIETNDIVDIKKGDLVFMNNGKWIVAEDVREKIIQKNCEFGIHNSKKTVIVLQKDN